MQKYGKEYYKYSSEKYGDVIKSIATNIKDFVNNMDDIRRHIHKLEKIPENYAPSIRAVKEKKGGSTVYYRSIHRPNHIEYFLMGFLKQLASKVFDEDLRINLKEERSDKPNSYSIISIKPVDSVIKKQSKSNFMVSNKCKDLLLEPQLMDQVLPFHILLNKNLEFVQLGDCLCRILGDYFSTHGIKLKTYFKLDIPPYIEFDYDSIMKNLNASFTISIRKEFLKDSRVNLTIRGKVAHLESSKYLWFTGSPKIECLHHIVVQIMTNRLKEASKKLALGKINTESILDQMFPREVAEKLMRNEKVQSVTTEIVTVLFTDIVGFTAICEQCDPEEITVMLNRLYIKFDFLCEKYQNYKVSISTNNLAYLTM